MVDKATRHSGGFDFATELKADKPYSGLTGYQSGTLAAEEWGKIDEGLDRSWIEAGDVCQRYAAFCALADEARAAWLAWAIARTLHAVVARKPRSEERRGGKECVKTCRFRVSPFT